MDTLGWRLGDFNDKKHILSVLAWRTKNSPRLGVAIKRRLERGETNVRPLPVRGEVATQARCERGGTMVRTGS